MTSVTIHDPAQPHAPAYPERGLNPPVNVLRLSLHPDGMAPRIARLAELHDELAAYGDYPADAPTAAALGGKP
jgi:hypothetical protein